MKKIYCGDATLIKEIVNPSQAIKRNYLSNVDSPVWAYLRRISNPNALRSYIESLEVSRYQKECYNTKAINCLDEAYKDTKVMLSISRQYTYERKIFFEKVVDTEGNVYAREITTGLLFPLLEECNVENKYYFAKPELVNSVLLIIKQNFTHESFHALNLGIFLYSPASIAEIEEYVRNISKSKIKELYENNSFAKNISIVEQDEEEKELREKVMTLLEQIEYKLSLLKPNQMIDTINSELTKLSSNKISDEEYLRKLLEISDRVELLSISKGYDDFNAFLKIKAASCLNSIGRKEDFDIDLNWINSLFDLFLRQNTDYSASEQRSITKSFVMMYIAVIKKYDLTEEDLEESHFKDILLTAHVCLNELAKEGLILDTVSETELTNISLSSVIDCIKGKKFKSARLSLSK